MCLAGQAQAHKAYLRFGRPFQVAIADAGPAAFGFGPKCPSGWVASISCSGGIPLCIDDNRPVGVPHSETPAGPNTCDARPPVYVAVQQPKHMRIGNLQHLCGLLHRD
jgi:hypothetical protein